MTSADAADGQDETAPGAVLLHGLNGVLRTGRLESAGPARERRQNQLVGTNHDQRDAHAQRHLRPRAAAKLPQSGKKISFDHAVRGARDPVPRNRHHVQASLARAIHAAPKHIAHHAFGAVPFDGAADATRRDDAQPIDGTAIGFTDERQEATRHAASAVVDGQKLPSMMQPDVRTKHFSHAGRPCAG